MKNNIGNKSVALLISIVLIGIPQKKVQAYTSNPPSGTTGSALDGASNNCMKSGCHGGSWTTGSSVITLSGLPASWIPSTTYTLTVAVTGSSPYGFEITAENASAKVGTFTAGTGSAILDGAAKHFVGQTSSRSSWSISYLTPAAGAGTINFYVAATAKKSNNFQRIYSVPEGSSTPAPTISAQPSNQTVSEGATATFSVTATGSGSLSYQWQKAPAGSSTFANISAATSSSYITPPTVIGDSTSQYRCVVTNSGGSTTSNAATLTVNAVAPTMSSHPSNQTVNEGATASFSVSASGSGLSYQWQKAAAGSSTFSNISAATSSSYTSPATTLAESTSQFRCVVTNSAGSITSNAATLTVNAAPPTITSQPSASSVAVSQTATFSISASGSGTLSYQWQSAPSGSSTFSNISGATSATYTTPATVLGDNGTQFKCLVTNSAGSATSNSATLTVTASAVAPTISSHPSNLTVSEGATATFSISATGSTPFTYQWQKAPAGSSTFANISGAINSSYTTAATTLADSTSQFRCIVTNTAGTATSNSAVLNVNATPPVISTNPSNKSVSEGATATFTVSVTGSSPLSYQWQKAVSGSSTFSNITGATSSTYTTPATTVVDSGAQYLCIVSNSAGLATSTPATLTVSAVVSAPTITTQPTDQTAAVGYSATFSLSATGVAPITYQWKKAPAGSSTFTNITGATNSSYATPVTTLADNTSKFLCVITNSAGSITSSTVTLTVTPPSAPTITDQPVDTYVLEGSTVTFSVVADSGGVDPLTYKWFKNSSQIIGEISPDLTIDNVTTANNGDVFMCIVTNAANLSATSNAVILKVGATPIVAAPQLTQVTTVGATDTLSLSNRYLNLKELQWTFTPVSTISNAQSVLGMSVAQTTTTGYTINLATLNLAPGIYQVSVVAVVSGGSTSTTTTMTITVIPGELNTVTVSPNPWVKLKNSQSPMVFANLSPGSVVKIYTLKGELIQTLYPIIDTASWNIKNEDGQWVASGTYYYVITDAKGHSHKSKIVVVR